MRIKWAHLSDIHHFYSNYKTLVMRDKLVEYVTTLKDDVDILFITGDIAHKGSKYNEKVISFLDDVVQACDVLKSNVFMIPGNHDIKRDITANRLSTSILQATDVSEELNTLDRKTYQHLLSGQKPFFNFYQKFMGEDYPKDALHFVKVRDGFNVIHINTCLMAGHNNAEGNILIGLTKLYDALKQIPNNEKSINIAIGHHTIGCIHNAEKDSLLNRFSDAKIDLYLNGHVHRATYHHDTNNINETFHFTCGGGFVDEFADPIFLTGRIDTDMAAGEVVYHSWNNEGEFWHIDNSVGRRTVNGSYKFEINRLKKKIVPIDETLKIVVDEDEFREFLINFHTVVSSINKFSEEFNKKDVTDKFVNMLCSATIKNQFDNYSIYFPIINNMMATTSFIGIDKKVIIPSVIIDEYVNVLHNHANGDLILTHMVDNLFNQYKSKVNYSDIRLKTYIRILIFWSIYECDIYNEDKRQKGVI